MLPTTWDPLLRVPPIESSHLESPASTRQASTESFSDYLQRAQGRPAEPNPSTDNPVGNRGAASPGSQASTPAPTDDRREPDLGKDAAKTADNDTPPETAASSTTDATSQDAPGQKQGDDPTGQAPAEAKGEANAKNDAEKPKDEEDKIDVALIAQLQGATAVAAQTVATVEGKTHTTDKSSGEKKTDRPVASTAAVKVEQRKAVQTGVKAASEKPAAGPTTQPSTDSLPTEQAEKPEKPAATAQPAASGKPTKKDDGQKDTAPQATVAAEPQAVLLEVADPASIKATAAETAGAAGASQAVAASVQATAESNNTDRPSRGAPPRPGQAEKPIAAVAGTQSPQAVETELTKIAATVASEPKPAEKTETISDDSQAVDGPSTNDSTTTGTHAGSAKGSEHAASRSAAAGEPGADQLSQVDRTRFVQRVERAIHSMSDGGGSIRLRLSPPELGSLQIEITVRHGEMNARLEAETPAARNLLLDSLPALRERLAQQDISIQRFDVDLMDRSGGGLPNHTGQFGDQSQSFSWDPGNRTPRTTSSGAGDPASADRAPVRRMTDGGQLNIIV